MAYGSCARPGSWSRRRKGARSSMRSPTTVSRRCWTGSSARGPRRSARARRARVTTTSRGRRRLALPRAARPRCARERSRRDGLGARPAPLARAGRRRGRAGTAAARLRVPGRHRARGAPRGRARGRGRGVAARARLGRARGPGARCGSPPPAPKGSKALPPASMCERVRSPVARSRDAPSNCPRRVRPCLLPGSRAQSPIGFAQLDGTAGCVRQPGDPADEYEEPPENCAFASGLDEASDAVLSPDQRFVYIVSSGGETTGASAITTFARDTTSGALSFAACVSATGGDGRVGSDGLCAHADALLGAHGLAITADGRFAYAVAAGSQAVSWFDRDPATGALTQRGCLKQSLGPFEHWSRVRARGRRRGGTEPRRAFRLRRLGGKRCDRRVRA